MNYKTKKALKANAPFLVIGVLVLGFVLNKMGIIAKIKERFFTKKTA